MLAILVLCIFVSSVLSWRSLAVEDYPLKEPLSDWSSVLPFTRPLDVQTPLLTGPDVVILQNLLRRHPGISLVADGVFGPKSKKALASFQRAEKIVPSDGILSVQTAARVLDVLMSDRYRDDGKIPPNVLFKLYVPVYKNRSVETTGVLYDSSGRILHTFRIRSRGANGAFGQELNQLTRNGDSPTGLVTFDLNSPQPDPKLYGPYPILRCVKGLAGNAALGRDNFTGIDGRDTFLSNYRSGILVHTGKWDNWQPGEDMPNSHGCFHVYPDDMKKIVDLLQTIGVKVRPNPFGKLPYPFKPQGIISVEELD